MCQTWCQQTHKRLAHSQHTPSFSSRTSIGKVMTPSLAPWIWRWMHLYDWRCLGSSLCLTSWQMAGGYRWSSTASCRSNSSPLNFCMYSMSRSPTWTQESLGFVEHAMQSIQCDYYVCTQRITYVPSSCRHMKHATLSLCPQSDSLQCGLPLFQRAEQIASSIQTSGSSKSVSENG